MKTSLKPVLILLVVFFFASCQKGKIIEDEPCNTSWYKEQKATKYNMLLNVKAQGNYLHCAGLTEYFVFWSDTNHVILLTKGYWRYEISLDIEKYKPLLTDKFCVVNDDNRISILPYYRDGIRTINPLILKGTDLDSEFDYFISGHNTQTIAVNKNGVYLIPFMSKKSKAGCFLIKLNEPVYERELFTVTLNSFKTVYFDIPNVNSVEHVYSVGERFLISFSQAFPFIVNEDATLSNVYPPAGVELRKYFSYNNQLFAFSFYKLYTSKNAVTWTEYCTIPNTLQFISEDNFLSENNIVYSTQGIELMELNDSIVLKGICTRDIHNDITAVTYFRDKIVVATLDGLYYADTLSYTK